MRALPASVKATIKQRIWASADALGWASFDVHQRSKQYGLWMGDTNIGGVLCDYMEPAKARAYLKDTLMKPYSRASLADEGFGLRGLDLDAVSNKILARFERPHGLSLLGNRIVCWGRADDWKLVLMALHERAYARNGVPFSAVLLPPFTRFPDEKARAVVVAASRKLGIERLEWIEQVARSLSSTRA